MVGVHACVYRRGLSVGRGGKVVCFENINYSIVGFLIDKTHVIRNNSHRHCPTRSLWSTWFWYAARNRDPSPSAVTPSRVTLAFDLSLPPKGLRSSWHVRGGRGQHRDTRYGAYAFSPG